MINIQKRSCLILKPTSRQKQKTKLTTTSRFTLPFIFHLLNGSILNLIFRMCFRIFSSNHLFVDNKHMFTFSTFSRALLLVLFCSTSTISIYGNDKDKDSKGGSKQLIIDFQAPQSPPKPTPEGMTWIDQGVFDSRLKGYRTPAGFKLEIVAEHPDIINPVGMVFADDGTLYVLEWTIDGGPGFEKTETITYKDGSNRQVSTMKKNKKDLLKVLSYNPAGVR